LSVKRINNASIRPN